MPTAGDPLWAAGGQDWWSARIGAHHVHFARGHGGQLIVLLDELDMVIVVTADALYDQTGQGTWNHEKAMFDLVGEFVKSLPKG